jgi:hypothetical protein
VATFGRRALLRHCQVHKRRHVEDPSARVDEEPLDRFSLRAEAHEWKPCQVWPRLAQRHLEIRP